MTIPKVIYQTFKNEQLPFLTRWHIRNLKRRNPEYDYQFYSDERIAEFILKEYGREIFDLYNRINIGAAKADFFRYAILYKKGGVYLDIDSLILEKLDRFILPTDAAIISLESHLQYYVQWALIFEPGHPILKRTLEIVIENLRANKFPNDVHKMTGPSAYTQAIKECIHQEPNLNYREVGIDYDRKFKFHYRASKLFLYGVRRKDHWRTLQQEITVLKKTD